MSGDPMLSLRPRWYVVCLAVLISISIPTFLSAQGTSARSVGRVADSSGAILPGTKVTLVNEATNVSRDTKTNDNGDYDFVEVPVGTYRLEFDLTGFKKNVRRGVSLDINQVITLNMTMQVGAMQEVVDVTSEAPLVETTSTQLGAVVGDRAVSELPLNSRDTYQLLQLQPGVMSTVGSSNSIVYGSSNAGAVSVNGGRGRSNNFSVNGGDGNDQFVNLPTVPPSPDSIQEFRVFPNTVLNANAYCLSPDGCTKPKFNQNQFGGTFGGPIKKDRTFFFASYEGRRIRQGITSPVVTVPTAQQRPSPTSVVNGQIVSDFSDVNPAGTFAGVLNNSALLTSRPGCQAANYAVNGPAATIQDGAPYGASTLVNPLPPVFPNSQIPLACMDPTAVDLLQFVPVAPNNGSLISTVPTEPIRGDQFTVKFDHRLNDKQNLSVYYYFDDSSIGQPFAFFELLGANVPGFGSNLAQRIQQWNITHTWTLNNSTVNEFRFNYNREGQGTFQHPQRTGLVQNNCPPPPSWLTAPVPCFYGDVAGNTYGIHTNLCPNREGLPFISISGGFSIGNDSEGELPQAGNSFQWSDNLTKVSGNHTFKFGVDVRKQQFNQFYYYNVNGTFSYYGGGPNDVGGNQLYFNYLFGLSDQFGVSSC